MKIFVSWSGDLSRKVAEILKKWIPCIIQSVEVFFSPEDIEKGDNWDRTISMQLSECKYGIICLTAENTNAPWVNFEAGAIAKTLDSKVAALMIDIKPSDIRGPLSRYQATKFEKEDFYQLVCSINKTLEMSLDDNVLKNAFEAMWPTMETEVNTITKQFAKNNSQKKVIRIEQQDNAPIEEILQLLRKQNSILSSPQNLLPMEYMEKIQMQIFEQKREINIEDDMLGEEMVEYFKMMLSNLHTIPFFSVPELSDMLNLEELMNIFKRYARVKNKKRVYMQLRDLDRELKQCTFEQKTGSRIMINELNERKNKNGENVLSTEN